MAMLSMVSLRTSSHPDSGRMTVRKSIPQVRIHSEHHEEVTTTTPKVTSLRETAVRKGGQPQ